MQARYVKIVLDTCYADSGYYYAGVDEIRAKTADGIDVALGKTVTASSQQSSTWKASNLVDGELTTAGTTHGWCPSTNYANGAINGNEYAVIDLGQSYDIVTLEQVSISTSGNWLAPLKAYRLYVSTDGINYTLVVTVTDGPDTYGRVDSFTLSAGLDDANSVVLLHFDGNLNDQSGKTWTAVGGATTSIVKSKFGGSSLYLNGSQHISTSASSDFLFGTGDFTVDFWIYPTATSRMFVIGNYNQAASTGWSIQTSVTNTNDVIFAYGGTVILNTSGGALTANTWNHVAVVRATGVLKCYVGGSSVGSVSDSTNISAGYTALNIGDNTFSSMSLPVVGYIDEPRVSNKARWTSNFTPPTAAYGPTISINKLQLVWSGGQ